MIRKSYDMSAGIVCIDLVKLQHTLSRASRLAHNALYQDMAQVEHDIEFAIHAHTGDDDEQFRGLCHANTHAKYLSSEATHYADCVEALFHISEAIKRDVVEFAPMKG